MNNYIFSYNFSLSSVPSDGVVRSFIKSNKYIDQWSYLFPGMYFIKSTSDFDDIDQSFDDLIGPEYYVLAKIGIETDVINGRLSPDVWNWLSGDDDDLKKIAPPESEN